MSTYGLSFEFWVFSMIILEWKYSYLYVNRQFFSLHHWHLPYIFSILIDSLESVVLLLLILKDYEFFHVNINLNGIPLIRSYLCITSILLYYCFVLQISPTFINIQIVYQSYIFLNSFTPIWVSFLYVLLSNDIETNPGDLANSFY